MRNKKKFRYPFLCITTVLAVFFTAGNLLAHGVSSSIKVEDSLPLCTFHYADGTALSYAEVKIWSPGNDEVEFQNGRTDKNGRFSFIPDRDGIWRITADDGLGHAVSAVYEVTGSVKTFKPLQKTEKPSLMLALFGVSLIFNLALVARLMK